MFKKYFEKKGLEKRTKETKANIVANRKNLLDLSNELSAMANWPRERLMDARDRQYEVLSTVANLADWGLVLEAQEAADLLSYKTVTKKLASFLDDEGSWCNPTTDTVRGYPYPKEDIKVLDPRNGHTDIGWFSRISADYYVKYSLNIWAKHLKTYAQMA